MKQSDLVVLLIVGGLLFWWLFGYQGKVDIDTKNVRVGGWVPAPGPGVAAPPVPEPVAELYKAEAWLEDW